MVGEVTLGESNFADESVSIALVSGTVTVQNNARLSLNVEDISGMVQIIDNIIFSGSVNKNTGGVEFLGNGFDFLSCTPQVCRNHDLCTT